MFTTTALVAFAALPQALASVFPTSPVATTVCNGGSPCQVAWNDDGTAPSLAQWGPTAVAIYVGSQQQQTQLQLIQDGVNVATTGSITFTPDPTIGPNDNIYFIRFTSDSLADPNNPNAHVEAFSAKFTLGNMSGQFNASVQAQIAGTTPVASSPPGASAPPSPASAPPTPSSASPSSNKPSSAASSAKTSSSAKPSTAAAKPMAVVSLAGVAAPLAALFALFL